MKLLVDFRLIGIEPVPWSVPEIGTGTRKDGKKFRFTTRAKKSSLHLGRASFADWQKAVAEAGRRAMQAIPVATSSIRLHMEFTVRSADAPGSLWDVPVAWDEETSKWVKKAPRGRPEPDLLNLMKGVEDALQGICYADDVLTRIISGAALCGMSDGVRVTVHLIEPSDFA